LRACHPDIDIVFVGTSRGIETELVPREGFRLELLPVVPLSRKPSPSWIAFPFVLFKSIMKVVRLIRREKIDIVVATGGYVAGPAILGSWLSGRPLVLCEQNSYPGLTSRVGSVFAKVVCTGLSGAENFLWRKSRIVETGNPVDIVCTERSREEILQGFKLDPSKKTLLVTGGSQGSQRINSAMLELLAEKAIPEGWSILWQTGRGKHFGVLAEIDSVPENVAIVPFISPMCEAYIASDAVVCRCGALTLSEIACYGVPAVLVPYPFAAGDHQRKNAESFAEAGAGFVIEDAKLDGKRLSEELSKIIDDEKNAKMSENMRSLGRPEATRNIVDIVEKFAGSNK